MYMWRGKARVTITWYTNLHHSMDVTLYDGKYKQQCEYRLIIYSYFNIQI
jgi:hypothetical protein